MKNLIIIGGTGVARGIIDAIEFINSMQPTWNLLGLLHREEAKQGSVFYRDVKILGPESSLPKYVNDDTFFILSYGSVKNFLAKEEYVQKLIQNNPSIRFANIIHPSVFISPSTNIGVGNFLAQNVIIDSNSSIGNHNIILFNSVIGRFVTIGDCCFLSANVNVMGNLEMKNNIFLGLKATVCKDVGENVFVNAGVFAGEPIEPNSIVARQEKVTLKKFGDRDQLKTTLDILGNSLNEEVW